MLIQRLAAAGTLIVSLGLVHALPAQDVVPVMKPPTWAPRVGQPVELTLPAEVAKSIAPGDIRVIVRSRGAQALIERQPGKASAPPVWRFTPSHEGTCIIATTIEPSKPATAGRTFRYEKLFLRVAPKDPNAPAVVRPSASATARFGHRLELAPLVDPACLRVGADLPVRVKFDGLDLTGATVVAKRAPSEPVEDETPKSGATATARAGAPAFTTAPAVPLRLTTNESAAVNLPIRKAGVWTITIEHRPAPDGSALRRGDRFAATMMFLVAEADTRRAGKGRRPAPRPPKQ